MNDAIRKQKEESDKKLDEVKAEAKAKADEAKA